MNEKGERAMDRRAVRAILDRIQDLPTIPHVLLEINRMLQDSEVSNSRVQEVIEKDQAITARILKLVNSPFYGYRTRIADISQALMILGFNTIRNSIATVAAVDIFRMKEKYDNFDIRDLWKHSLAVAVTSKHLAEASRKAPLDDCFVSGLLHDIGKLVMEEHLPDFFRKVLALQKEEGLTFFAAEKKILPVNHALIGGYLVGSWHFPAHLVYAIEHHHQVTSTVSDFWLHIFVYAANTIVNHQFRESGNEEIMQAFPGYSSIMPLLGDFKEWHLAVEEEIDKLCQAF